MKKNKGFTLIELLAVIVILAIIALIAVPQVLKILNQARRSAAEDSVYGVVEAAENYVATLLVKNAGGLPSGNIEFECNGTTCNLISDLTGYTYDSELSVKGTVPKEGNIIIKNNGTEIVVDNLHISNYECEYTNGKSVCTNYIENKYKEDILNGADPVLSEDLVPVKISSSGVVTKAKLTEQWYDYETQNWANAVVLKNKQNYNDNQEIPESNIKQYYVWIPRYRYQLWNTNNESKYPNNTSGPSAINIVFEGIATQESTGSNNGEWLTHPAFTNFGTKGIWVGKFETSYDEQTYTDSSKFGSNPNVSATTNANNLLIKPNVRSLTNKTISEFYTLGKDTLPNLNSHMMTNMEWGAVAYLTYSIYGKCDSISKECTEVYINNVNTGYGNETAVSGMWQWGATVTGCSASEINAASSDKQTGCASGYAWNGANNKASTTGNQTSNITGIYDMSGGAWEYVMGVLTIDNTLVSGNNSTYNSGFNGIYSRVSSGEKTNGIAYPNNKYYNLYNYNYNRATDIWYDYTTGQLGDATREIALTKANSSSGDSGLWFSDYAYFPTAAAPWFGRGGYSSSSSGAGVFSFYRSHGFSYSDDSFRVVLAY